MGDGRSDESYVSFLIHWLSECLGICLWYMFLVVVFVMFGRCTYVCGCKYCHEICYKTPISGMGVMILCCYVVMLVSFSIG